MNSISNPAAGEAAHTHTPYWAQPAFQSATNLWSVYVMSEGGVTIAHVRASTKEQAEANAAFIVRACNSHAPLMAYVKKQVAHLEWRKANEDDPEVEPLTESEEEELAEAYTALESAK